MKIKDYFDIQADDDIRIRGSRIGIESVLYEYIHRSQTPEQIAARFHTLTLEQVYATILYYLHNKEAVSAYLADWLDYCHQSREKALGDPATARLRERLRKAKAAGAETTAASA